MNLYLDDLPGLENAFRKEAGFAARLSEAPENWPQELTSEIMKQLPYLSDYDVSVNLDRVEPQRGFAFGYADVGNKTERPEMEHEETGMPHVRIPVVVIERAVKPFSVFLDGEKVMPLTEDRIRELLFNSQTFDLSNSEPRDPSLIDAVMPPNRSGSGHGGEVKTAGIGARVGKFFQGKANKAAEEAFRHTAKKFTPHAVAGVGAVGGASYLGSKAGTKAAKKEEMKTASSALVHAPGVAKKPGMSGGKKALIAGGALAAAGGLAYGAKKLKEKKASILQGIAETIRESDAEAFTMKVASDASLVAGFRRSGIAGLLVDVLENTPRLSADERLEKVASSIMPTVITIQKLPGGDFLFKTGASNAFAGGQQAQGEVVPPEQAAEAMGEENAQAMQPGQSATAVADPVEEQPLYTMNEKPCDEFGEWLVQDSMGNRLMGWVFPKVLAWDGNFTPQDIALFTNGSAYAFQDTIAGRLVGKSTTFPSDTPRGDGVFWSTEDGNGICTAPLMIGSSAAGPDGQQKFIGTDVMGTQVQVSLQQGLNKPMRVSDTEYALPSTWKFMRLNNQTELVQDPVQMNKAAQIQEMQNSVTLFWNGSYNLEGGCGLGKVARDLRYDLDPVHAEFMLGLLGVEGGLAKQKVAEARKKGHVKMAGLRTITLLSERYAQHTKTASALASKVPDLRRDLIKEAAAMDDSGTVDNLLSLNFINPENISQFISYLPELEETSEKLAEMLLFCYLGVKDLPEGAVERSMKNMEEVIQGLKSLQNVEA
jgi:hypothetical protein